MQRWIAILIALLMIPGLTRAQFTGYISSGIGAHSNPLYNYEMVPDAVAEEYLELKYTDESDVRVWTFGYIGGAMFFRQLSPRNYYEHRGKLDFQAEKLRLAGSIAGRHDKSEFKEFDNFGAELSGSYAWEDGSPGFTLSDVAGLRNYPYVQELSNIYNTVQAAFSSGSKKSLAAQYTISFGIKHFTTTSIDTGSFAVVHSSGKGNNGKGKSMGPGLGSQSSSGKKQYLLSSSGSVNSVQIAAGVSLGKEWKGGGMDAGLTYRLNPGSDARLLSNVANNSVIGGDLYNDNFNYGGPELLLSGHQELILGLHFSATGEVQLRRYLAPAFDLNGVQTDPERVDMRGSVQVSLARSLPLGENVSLDLTITVTLQRNSSNDAYNDFSASAAGLSIGVGF
ncbi:MAG: hypothetical protein AB1428_14870 [Bacteroidota bacterium]